MHRSLRWILIALGLGTLSQLCAVPVSAQPLWTSQDRQTSVAVEWHKPSFDEDRGRDDIGFLTSALFLSGRVAVADNLRLVGELPVAHLSIDSDFGDETNTALGNPYLGLEVDLINSLLWGEVGLRAPLASGDDVALEPGLFADADRFEAFVPDALSVIAMGNIRLQSASGIGVRLRGGASLVVDTDDEEFEDETEVILTYSAQGWYGAGQVQVGAGLTGRLFTSEEGNLGEISFHHLGLSVIGTFGMVQPGVHIRLPLDEDLSDFIDSVFGLNLTVLIL